MDDMKLRFWMMGLAGILACATGSAAITYYVDDNSNDGDVYTPDYTGNDSNDGLSPSSPKLTINNLLASTNLLAIFPHRTSPPSFRSATVSATWPKPWAGHRMAARFA